MPTDIPLRLHGSDERLRKHWRELAVRPDLTDREATHEAYSWAAAQAAFSGLPEGALNIAHAVVDRHAEGPAGDRVAIRWLGADGRGQRITYRQLREQSNRFANLLTEAGLRPGDTLFTLAPRVPELYGALLGALKAGLVVAPLQPDSGPDPIATRLSLGGGRALLTTASLYRRDVEPVRDVLPALEHVWLVGDGGDDRTPQRAAEVAPLLRDASAEFVTVATRPEDPALLHFTGGTGGRPKGVVQPHQAVLALWSAGRLALDLHPGDVYWYADDPGAPGGLFHGVITPLAHGVTLVADECGFVPARWYDVLERQGVTVWYAPATALHRLMKQSRGPVGPHRFPRLRLAASFGEPLTPHAVLWGQDVLGTPIHDQWWQTETGCVMIGNTLAQDIKPGSMGQALPGVRAFIVARRPDGTAAIIDTPEAQGELALRSGWPSMFMAYRDEPARYRKCFAASTAGELYLTGDLVRRDADGYHWFVGRADELIRSAGLSIGPGEVESALSSHPAVEEVAAVGEPDPVMGARVHAYVALKPGFDPGETLRRELLRHAREHLGPDMAPHSLDFASQLPHTRSGKLMRRLVRAQALGLPAAVRAADGEAP